MAEEVNYDIRSILEEMRQEYWQGLTGKSETRGEFLDCITFTLGNENYAFETSFASEVIRVPKLVKLPGGGSAILGIFNLRGEIIAAMDIRGELGIQAGETGSAARIIVVRHKKFTTGILVERVDGVHPLPLDQFEPIVKSVESSTRDFLRGQINQGGEMTILLDVNRLLDSPLFSFEQE